MQSKKIFVAKCVAILSVIPVLIWASVSGPPPRTTAAPGDNQQACTQAGCHVGTALNSNGNKIEVSFEGGANYVPGQRQRITIRVTEPRTGSTGVFGFQMTARLASNEANGQAGRFTTAESNTFVQCNDGSARDSAPLNGTCRDGQTVEFIQHNLPKEAGEWVVDWTPPATDAGPVRFYVAANVANGNGQPSNDKIYTANFTLTPGAGGGGGGNRPAIRSTNGVVNGASFTAGIQSGSWVTVFGENLASATRIWNSQTEIVNGVLPTELDGVKVNIGGKPAAVYFISPGQLNVQAPDEMGTGNVAVEVINANGTSSAVTAEARTAAPAFFMFDPESRRYLAAVHADGTFLGKAGLFPTLTTRPAKPGDVLLLFGTGFGATNPPVQSGRVFTGAAPLVAAPTVRIGNVAAQVQFAGLSGAGLYQINVVVPDVPDGDRAVVAELPGGLSTQQNAFITIQR